MTGFTIPRAARFSHDHMRPLNITRDLSPVADLIELCFNTSIDRDSQRYVQQMRRAGRDNAFLRWANRAADTVSMPLTGYVWEEDGRIVGNASLIPFRKKGQSVYLVANVAVHPDFRRRGIARILTQQTIQHARDRKAAQIWLNVRDDNPGAADLYRGLGFREHSRRTVWLSQPDLATASVPPGLLIRSRRGEHWPRQREWLEKAYPPEIEWYFNTDWHNFAPGFRRWLYLLLIDMDMRQWSVLEDDRLHAVLTWTPGYGSHETLWLAAPPEAAPQAVKSLLQVASRELAFRRTLRLDFPAGPLDETIQSAGYIPTRRLIWMLTDGATH
jgi:GNAT superfamily N-acetyltransferase